VADADQAYGGVPPEAWSVWLKGWPCSALGNEVEVTLSEGAGGGLFPGLPELLVLLPEVWAAVPPAMPPLQPTWSSAAAHRTSAGSARATVASLIA